MPRRSDRGEGREEMTACYVARKSLGDGGLSQQKFAELTGRSKSMVQRREKGTLDPDPTSLTFYTLVIAVSSGGLRYEALKTLEAVEGSKSEAKGLLALFMMCLEKGRMSLVKNAIGEELKPGDHAEGEGPSMDDMVRHLSTTIEGIERQAKGAPDSVRARFTEASADMARAVHNLKQGYRELREQKSRSKSRSEDPPDP